METLPIELVAEIARISAKTWGSMLFVFRGLHTKYFDHLARGLFIRTDERKYRRTTYVDGVQHSIGGQPAKTRAHTYEKLIDFPWPPIPWDLLGGEVELPDHVPPVAADKIKLTGLLFARDLRKELRRVYCRSASILFWCWNNLRIDAIVDEQTQRTWTYRRRGAVDVEKRKIRIFLEIWRRPGGTNSVIFCKEKLSHRVDVFISQIDSHLFC